MAKKTDCCSQKSPFLNTITNIALGIGLGALFTYPYFGDHPVRWGIVFLILAGVGYLYPYLSKK